MPTASHPEEEVYKMYEKLQMILKKEKGTNDSDNDGRLERSGWGAKAGNTVGSFGLERKMKKEKNWQSSTVVINS